MTPRVREILSWYGSENPGVLANLARIMNHGRLRGTGKMLTLSVDQAFEHGPALAFAQNPDGYDPAYHIELAIESGCNAYAAPLGFIEACAREYAGEIPLLLQMNNSETFFSERSPTSALTSAVDDALRLGCAGICLTIYPGSAHGNEMYQDIQQASQLAKKAGLAVVIWSCPRREQLSFEGETAIDVCAYGAHIAAQLGAHIIKVKPPSAHIEQEAARKVYQAQGIRVSTLADRARHVLQCSFSGKRIVIFSGGESKSNAQLISEVKELAQGGAFGSMMGLQALQRPRKEAIDILQQVQDAFVGRAL